MQISSAQQKFRQFPLYVHFFRQHDHETKHVNQKKMKFTAKR